MSANDPAGTDGRSAQPATGKLPAELIAFAVRKEARAKEVASRFNATLPAAVWEYFEAATQGNWPEVARLGEELRNPTLPPGVPKPDPTVTTYVWSAIMEIYMAFGQCALGEPKYAMAFGRDIISSIPPGSIYFGGTDAGRGLVTALCRSHETGDPFFTLTQSALSDRRSYLRYAREIYGRAISIPSDEDVQQALNEYRRDFDQRKRENRLLPGEEREGGDGEFPNTIFGVWAVNGALAKLIFDRNPDREFFVEESFPLQWMQPHLAPHGLILRISRQPLATLSPDLVEQDQKFWSDRVGQMLGDWLRPETPLSEVCAFADRVFVRKDLAGFTGDPAYVASAPARDAFSKLRAATAGLYQWRARKSSDATERRRMAVAADFASRQAFALDPGSAHAAFRFMGHLFGEKRPADALLVAETASAVSPENAQLHTWVQDMRRDIRKEQS
jgi:hypothetical protein